MNDLLTEVKAGNVQAVESLLTQKEVDLCERDRDGWMPLHWAIYKGNFPIAKKLIKEGKLRYGPKYLEKRTGQGTFNGLETALIVAARFPNANMFYLLLVSGASCDAKEQNGKSVEGMVEGRQPLKSIFLAFRNLQTSQELFRCGESERGLALISTAEEQLNEAYKNDQSIAQIVYDMKLKIYCERGNYCFRYAENAFAKSEYEIAKNYSREATGYFSELAKICDSVREISIFLEHTKIEQIRTSAEVKLALIRARCHYEDYCMNAKSTQPKPIEIFASLPEAKKEYEKALALEADLEVRESIQEKIASIDKKIHEFEVDNKVKNMIVDVNRICRDGEEQSKMAQDETEMQKALVSYEVALGNCKKMLEDISTRSKAVELKVPEILRNIESLILSANVSIAVKKGNEFLSKAKEERSQKKLFDALARLADANKYYAEALALDQSLEYVREAQNEAREMMATLKQDLTIQEQTTQQIQSCLKQGKEYYDAAGKALSEKQYQNANQLYKKALSEYQGILELINSTATVEEQVKRVNFGICLTDAQMLMVKAQSLLTEGITRLIEASTTLEKANVELEKAVHLLQDLDSQYQPEEVSISQSFIADLRNSVDQEFIKFYLKKGTEKNTEADIYLKNGKYIEAHLCYVECLWVCEKALTIEPGNGEAKEFKEKIEIKAKGLKNKFFGIAPTVYTDVFNRGIELVNNDRVPMAINYFSDIGEIIPNFFEAQYNRRLLERMQKIRFEGQHEHLNDDSRQVIETSPYEYACMCEHTYNPEVGLASKLAEWRIMCKSDDKEFSQHGLIGEGFLGIAYVNEVTKQIVIAYRGTDINFFSNFNNMNLENLVFNLRADVILFAESKDRIFALANAFFHCVSDKKIAHYPDYQLSFTGHSLGAALAEVMAIETRISAVTFESPGSTELISKEMLKQLRSLSDGAKFKVVCYVSEPNLINTANTHLVKVLPCICQQIRIFPLMHVLKRNLMLSENTIRSITDLVDREFDGIVNRFASNHAVREFIDKKVEQEMGIWRVVVPRSVALHKGIEPYKRNIMTTLITALSGINYLWGRTMTTHSMHSIFKFFEHAERYCFPVLQEEMQSWPKGRLAVIRYHELIGKDLDTYAFPLSVSQQKNRADEYLLKNICGYQTKVSGMSPHLSDRKEKGKLAFFNSDGSTMVHFVCNAEEKLENRKAFVLEAKL